MKFDSRFAALSVAALIALSAPATPQEDAGRADAPAAPVVLEEPAPAAVPAAAAPEAAPNAPESSPPATTEASAPPAADAPREVAQESAPVGEQPAAIAEEPAPVARAPASVAGEPAPIAERPAAEQPVADQPALAAEPAPLIPDAAPPVETAAPAAPEPAAAPQESRQTAEPVAPAPSPIQTALREAVERMLAAPVSRPAPGQTPAAALRREREAIAAFYEARDFAPLWIQGESFTPSASSAVARIGRAREDGLDLGQYLPPTLDASTPEGMARADLALSEAAVGYARQASGVRVEPRTIGLVSAKPDVAAPQDVLAKLAASDDAGEVLASHNPPHQGYRDLREKLFELRRERPAVAQRIAPGPVLKVGMKDPRVPLVRARFGINAAADKSDEHLVYDTRVASAVADFQRAHGLPANGALTGRTIAALSGGDPSRLEGEILANMEKWRWLPRDMGETRIEVNIPDFRARLIRDGKIVHSMRVIVGKPETPTPVFSDTMEFMVVNPSWHVPQSIIRKQLAQDPTYYARNGYEVVRRGNNIFVRQPPGERNALGFVKFMFPNDHAVYMHDTPTRHLFSAARRAFSHGCVRVDQPFRFAEALLPETGWSEQRLRTVIGKGERTIKFSQGVPVHLMYFTAYVDDDGKVQLREDLYGQTRKLQAALGL